MNKDCVDSMHEWREAHAARQALHAEQVDAAIKFGLRRFEHAFASKKLAASIPPGWRDICHTGLRDALKEAATASKGIVRHTQVVTNTATTA